MEDSSLVGDGLEYHGLANGLADGRGYVSPFAAPGQPSRCPRRTSRRSTRCCWRSCRCSAAAGTCRTRSSRRVVGTGTVRGLRAARRPARRPARRADRGGASAPSTRCSSWPTPRCAPSRSTPSASRSRCWPPTAPGRSPTAWRLAQLGAVIGLATLARSEGIVLLVLLALPVAWRRGPAGARQAAGARSTAACVVVLAPWLIRCWIVFDEPVFDLHQLRRPARRRQLRRHSTAARTSAAGRSRARRARRARNEAVVARRLRERGLRYARDHAERLPAVVAARALRPWGLFDPDGEVRGKTLGEGRSETANWVGPGGLLGADRRWPWSASSSSGGAGSRCHPRRAVPARAARERHRVRHPAFRAPADVALVVLGAVALDALLRACARSRRRALARLASSAQLGVRRQLQAARAPARRRSASGRASRALRAPRLGAHVAAGRQQLAHGGDQHLPDRRASSRAGRSRSRPPRWCGSRAGAPAPAPRRRRPSRPGAAAGTPPRPPPPRHSLKPQ